MPTYSMINKDTNEIFEVTMKISEYDQYMLDHPNIERYHGFMPPIIDEVRIGRKKPPADFQKYVIEKIKAKNPGNNMQSRFETPKEW